MSYNGFIMTSTLSIRLRKEQRDSIRRKAKSLGKTESEFVREVLFRAVDQRPMSERLKGLRTLSFKNVKLEGWRKVIHEHNWRS